ncbi:MAG: hypothetical protein IKN54_08960 [Lachnospiraceae bacterium]|nr:hypothetical protein [Lachnospiraceae bacterium]
MKINAKKIIAAFAIIVGVSATAVTAHASEKVADTVSVTDISTKNDKVKTVSYQFDASDSFSDNDTAKSGMIIPIKIKSSGYAVFSVKELSIQKDIEVAVFNDQKCTSPLSGVSFDSLTTDMVGDTVWEGFFAKAGTYYIKLASNNTYTDETLDEFTNKFTISFKEYTADTRTVKSGNVYQIYNQNAKTVWFKYVAKKNGSLTISNLDKADYKVTLTNKKKKSLTSTVKVSSSQKYKTAFCVEKGNTYYLKVTNIKPKSGKIISDYKFSITEIKDKSGKKKKKAVVVKVGKYATGMMASGDKDDWYKVKIPKRQKGKLDFTFSGQGKVKITVYAPMGDKIGTCENTGKKASYKITYDRGFNNNSGKVMNGIYYIKVTKGTKTTNGVYKLRWAK